MAKVWATYSRVPDDVHINTEGPTGVDGQQSAASEFNQAHKQICRW